MNNAQWQRFMNALCGYMKIHLCDMSGIQRKAVKDEVNRYLKDKWEVE